MRKRNMPAHNRVSGANENADYQQLPNQPNQLGTNFNQLGTNFNWLGTNFDWRGTNFDKLGDNLKKYEENPFPKLFGLFHFKPYLCTRKAPVAKLVDAPDLGSGVAIRVGSSPIRRTIQNPNCLNMSSQDFCFYKIANILPT